MSVRYSHRNVFSIIFFSLRSQICFSENEVDIIKPFGLQEYRPSFPTQVVHGMSTMNGYDIMVQIKSLHVEKMNGIFATGSKLKNPILFFLHYPVEFPLWSLTKVSLGKCKQRGSCTICAILKSDFWWFEPEGEAIRNSNKSHFWLVLFNFADLQKALV